MRVVIADDEPQARSHLVQLCRQCGDLDIAAEAASGGEAIQAIQVHRPDLVVLDVELQDMSGFDVLAALEGAAPTTIMVTAHREHALRAFDVEALDFLTKPIDESRFEAAIDRARQRRPQALTADWCEQMTAALCAALDGQMRTPGARTRLLAEKSRRLHFIEPGHVECIEADGNYVVVHTDADRYIARSTLKQLALTLAPLGFLRIERSLLINLPRVAFMEKIGGGCYAFTLRSGRRLVSGEAYGKEIQRKIRYAQLA
ncbi:MAG TPA: LytTR family DNA-binding domain-containing protein [Steroidobacteraceae bacterium]|nr:LytTR family DNA-binding domain-containing protein [Steroidobacteraceae bacterium]